MERELPIFKPKQEEVPPHTDLRANADLTDDDIRKLMKRWGFERQHYPGWIIAPEDKRSSIFYSTEYVQKILLKTVENWSASDRIAVYQELNWRLELCMIPLFQEQIAPFEVAVCELFDSLSTHEKRVDSNSKFCLPEAEILEAWMQICFGLMREARETYNSSKWENLSQKIDTLILRIPQYSDRFSYEKALWEMWNVKRDAARAILSAWTPTPTKPLAAIWKAGLLAELNELGEALELLHGALQEIRHGEKIQGENIELFSLEGWCTYLIREIETSSLLTAGSRTTTEFRERWHKLKTWDCNPLQIKESLENALSEPTQEHLERVKEVRQFEPGRVSIRFSAENLIYRYWPAFAYIRFFEQAGVPLRLPSNNLTGDNLRKACLCISPFINFWSPAILIRAGHFDDLIDGVDSLSRTNVATMEQNLVDRWQIWCSDAWDRERKTLNDRSNLNFHQRTNFMVCLAEFLSRLSFRLNQQELRENFKRVLDIYPLCGPRHGLTDRCDAWFQRLFDAADAQLLLEWLPDLLRAPLTQKEEPRVTTFWNDAINSYPSDRVAELPLVGELEEVIGACVRALLRSTDNDNSEIRNRAMLRLLRLHEAQKLNQEQIEQFSKILWSHKDDDGLPAVKWMRWKDFCSLPSPTKINPIDIVKQKILNLNPLEGGVILNPDGSISVPSGRLPLPDLIYRSATLSKSTSMLYEEEKGFIEWSDDEASKLFSGAEIWWQSFKSAKMANAALLNHLNKHKIGNFLAEFLVRTVIPHLKSVSNESTLMAWVDELRTHSIFASKAIPYLLSAANMNSEKYTQLLIDDLNSDNPLAVAAAASAVPCFLSLIHQPDLKLSLTKSLVERVIFRRKASLFDCVNYLSSAVLNTPKEIENELLELLISSLIVWNQQLSLKNRSDKEFDEGERPEFRALVGFLSGLLGEAYAMVTGCVIEPKPISEWRTSCAEDSLPEVRRSFSEGASLFVSVHGRRSS